MHPYPGSDEIHELKKRLDAIPRETREVICCNCLKEYIAEIFQGDRVFRCPSCAAKRLAAMNNEGDLPAEDGVISSSNEAEASS